jgi:hypothetical protein
MILKMEARDANAAREHEANIAEAAREAAAKAPTPVTPAPTETNSGQAEETISFELNPCEGWIDYPAPVVVIQAADMLPLALAGWEMNCTPRWSIAGRVRGKMTWPPTAKWMPEQRKIDGGLCALIGCFWFLAGGFPLVRRQRWQEWWRDPGGFITACAVPAGILALIPAIDGAASLPALIAMFAWYWWFGLLVWKSLRYGWRWVTGKTVQGG